VSTPRGQGLDCYLCSFGFSIQVRVPSSYRCYSLTQYSSSISDIFGSKVVLIPRVRISQAIDTKRLSTTIRSWNNLLLGHAIISISSHLWYSLGDTQHYRSLWNLRYLKSINPYITSISSLRSMIYFAHVYLSFLAFCSSGGVDIWFTGPSVSPSAV